MSRTAWLTAGVAGGVIVALGLVRGAGIGTRRDPFFLEARVARASWRWLVPPKIRDTANPVPAWPGGIDGRARALGRSLRKLPRERRQR